MALFMHYQTLINNELIILYISRIFHNYHRIVHDVNCIDNTLYT